MKSFLCALSVAVVVSSAAAAPQSEHDTMGRLTQSSEQRLTDSIQELNRLREQIAAEKLPLAQQLTASEEKLAQLRRDHDKVSREVDAGNLEIPTLKGQIKARQDELAYISNLLDEYARTLATKVNVSELQSLGEAIETAKSATENTTLTMPERFARQMALAKLSVTRLFDAIGGMRFDGVGVDLQGNVTSGQYAILGPVALFRAATGGAAGVVVPQTGSLNPLIRPLEGAMQSGLISLVETGQGTMPLDPSLGGALTALVQKTNLFYIFEKGGPIMWPLLLLAVVALGTVLERVLFLTAEKIKCDPKALDQFFTAIGHGDIDGAVRIAKATKFYVLRALGYALAHKETSLASAILYAQAQELKRFRRGVPILDTVITLAPLLGLLGTIVGMMASFKTIGGDLSAPSAITGGIAEALIATAFGLGIAITALLPFNFLNARTEDARHELESASTQLELLVQSTQALHAHAPNSNERPVDLVPQPPRALELTRT